jgi:hypothetical protein
MTLEDLTKLAHDLGAKTYTEPPMRAVSGVSLTYAQLAALANELQEQERKRCSTIIFGMCSSDNVAQRTVDAIWKKPK